MSGRAQIVFIEFWRNSNFFLPYVHVALVNYQRLGPSAKSRSPNLYFIKVLNGKILPKCYHNNIETPCNLKYFLWSHSKLLVKLLDASDIYCLEIATTIILTGNTFYFDRWCYLQVAAKWLQKKLSKWDAKCYS